MKSTIAVGIAVVLCATAAQAQPYVAASISADVVRNGTYDDARSPGTGEALSFSLRTGATITPRFGIELDFTRAAEIETDDTPDVRILSDLQYTVLSIADVVPPTVVTAPSFYGYKVHTEQQSTTITAAAWARQEVSPRFSLVYLGGIAFARLERSVSTSFDFPRLSPTILPPTYQTNSVEYTAGPMAGFEARIGLTEHAQLIPGFRLLTFGGGWITRPAVGLGWTF